jgi:hypothetical protein
VGLKAKVNAVLLRATGHRIVPVRRRAARPTTRQQPAPRPPVPVVPGDRLVETPVFILCSLRSGSTLLRVLLDSHPEIHAPHELHLRALNVRVRGRWARRSMQQLGLGPDGLRFLLWDRLLHRELARSGKKLIVDKTPNNVFVVDELLECWPDARFVFLLRHPAAIARSRARLRPADAHNVERIREYCEALEQARRAHPGHTVRYEELTVDPERVTRGLCAYLGVQWDERMLDYGAHDHGPYHAGLGDFADKIGKGRVQPADPPPADVPAPLRQIAAAWGYGPGIPAADTPATPKADTAS